MENFDNLRRSRERALNHVEKPKRPRKAQPDHEAAITATVLLEDEPKCVEFTGFGRNGLLQLFGLLGYSVEPRSNFGTGRKANLSSADRICLVLVRLRTAPKVSILSALFGISKPNVSVTFTNSIREFSSIADGLLKRTFTAYLSDPRRAIFNTEPRTCVAIDCTFFVHPPPSNLSFEQQKNYFSVKHGNYGWKALAAVSAEGKAIFFSRLYPGAVHDITVAKDDEVIRRLQELYFATGLPLLADKGFVGLDASVPCLVPSRRRSANDISLEEEEISLSIARERVVVENYFGRLKELWPFIKKAPRTPIDSLEETLRFSVYLTNFHIGHHPLRA